MKFLCEQCKTKYQIGDEKVAGKTVRMKCRKCGHLIEVRAAVTETSVTTAAPEASGSPPATSGAPRPPPKAPQRTAPLATSLAAAKPPAKTEKSGALAGAFKTNVQREDEASAPFDMDLSPSDEWYVAINGVPVGPIRIAEVRRKAALGAVTDDSLAWQEGLDEWRPVKSFPDLAAIVREAASSARASLTPPPPEVRVSPPAQARPAPPRAPAPPAPRPAAPRAPAPPPAAPPTARSNVVPITSRLATAEKLSEDIPLEDMTLLTPAPGMDEFAPLRESAPAPAPPAAAFQTPMPPAAVAPAFGHAFAADPFAHPPAPVPAALIPPAPVTAPLPPMGAAPMSAVMPIMGRPVATASVPPPYVDSRGRKAPPWGAIAMLVAALGFGISAAVMLIRPAAPAPVIVQMPAAAPTATAGDPKAAASVANGDTPDTPTAPTAPTSKGPSAVAMGGTKAAPSATATAHGPLDLKGLMQGSNVLPTDETGNEAPKAPGQCLSEGQVQQVLGLHTMALRRTCWERNPTTKLTVNVTVSMTIGPDGTPQGVAASGDEASVSKCIENDVRNWHFPAMGCSQKTAIPFKFARQ